MRYSSYAEATYTPICFDIMNAILAPIKTYSITNAESIALALIANPSIKSTRNFLHISSSFSQLFINDVNDE